MNALQRKSGAPMKVPEKDKPAKKMPKGKSPMPKGKKAK
jgi:hypothetical protein